MADFLLGESLVCLPRARLRSRYPSGVDADALGPQAREQLRMLRESACETRHPTEAGPSSADGPPAAAAPAAALYGSARATSRFVFNMLVRSCVQPLPDPDPDAGTSSDPGGCGGAFSAPFSPPRAPGAYCPAAEGAENDGHGLLRRLPMSAAAAGRAMGIWCDADVRECDEADGGDGGALAAGAGCALTLLAACERGVQEEEAERGGGAAGAREQQPRSGEEQSGAAASACRQRWLAALGVCPVRVAAAALGELGDGGAGCEYARRLLGMHVDVDMDKDTDTAAGGGAGGGTVEDADSAEGGGGGGGALWAPLTAAADHTAATADTTAAATAAAASVSACLFAAARECRRERGLEHPSVQSALRLLGSRALGGSSPSLRLRVWEAAAFQARGGLGGAVMAPAPGAGGALGGGGGGGGGGGSGGFEPRAFFRFVLHKCQWRALLPLCLTCRAGVLCLAGSGRGLAGGVGEVTVSGGGDHILAHATAAVTGAVPVLARLMLPPPAADGAGSPAALARDDDGHWDARDWDPARLVRRVALLASQPLAVDLRAAAAEWDALPLDLPAAEQLQQEQQQLLPLRVQCFRWTMHPRDFEWFAPLALHCRRLTSAMAEAGTMIASSTTTPIAADSQ